ncbi:MAG: DUF86 domain-containing protein [Candidatus Terrybacteria bacterium CG10_big_fil_rev_8_21_14_0_10_41_10]|uniref:DUF86 domain-containing protein n=1 Tax=Candidatus Terrybacteria bacterium CG10_big_fil_rev_8_21_14_0_10_41_10 TaxID=1975026 RepID=A0A2M8LAQ6_9BACT|nr:MAG: DUF86 domain-containing protein [Candidatus Terrybacteria bacterium CG10_big_fil_rev_8_21_14_0_10_41_10]
MSKEAYNKIISKLQKLDEYTKYLKEIQKVNKEQFVEDYHFFGLAERYLQLSIEILLDVGKLLIVIKGLKRPEENQEIFSALCDEKIVSEKLADNLMGIANFRNILVHDYEKIDREIIYEKLRNNLDDFENFKKEIVRYVNKYI